MERSTAIDDHEVNVSAVGEFVEFLEDFRMPVPIETRPIELERKYRIKLPRHECHLCGASYVRKESFHVHMGIHAGFSPYTCSICKKMFTQKIGLERHQSVHTVTWLYQCDHCGRRFRHEKTFRNHLTEHSGKKYTYCSHCNQGFTSTANLLRHSRIHTKAKPFMCEICGQRFSHSSNMYVHIRSKHQKIRRIRCKESECPLCGKNYPRKELMKHLIADHSDSVYNGEGEHTEELSEDSDIGDLY